ncbi:hypothetical protein XSR1_230055 [Xenorhabdus szentirmaii DSM 16338]|uniref:Uncharacterized protein n=1 Tax=Xenorhabdus szentirmaii DSM 16338 TaxID=1427518 RepID=W1IY36_9GAMM|nr:hypothetical protein XSR1_230055 [Xenorhabdus szentirmaii DSM 16338]
MTIPILIFIWSKYRISERFIPVIHDDGDNNIFKQETGNRKQETGNRK